HARGAELVGCCDALRRFARCRGRCRRRSHPAGTRLMMLGDILAAARNSSGRFLRWLAHCDPDLSDQVTDRAAKEGIGPASFVRVAVADFAAHAAEEDWATLTSSLREAD